MKIATFLSKEKYFELLARQIKEDLNEEQMIIHDFPEIKPNEEFYYSRVNNYIINAKYFPFLDNIKKISNDNFYSVKAFPLNLFTNIPFAGYKLDYKNIEELYKINMLSDVILI